MNNKLSRIKSLIKKECEKNGLASFYEHHLMAVEKNAQELLSRLPKADKETVMLGVWLHGLKKVRKLKGDPEEVGSREAEKVLKEFQYPPETITLVKDIIMTHRCKKHIPTTLEARALATADAMSQYSSDWVLNYAMTEGMSLAEFKKFMIEKLEHNYNHRIFFSFAKKLIQKRHEALMYVLTMN